MPDQTMKSAMLDMMATSLRRNAFEMGHVLGISFPDWVSDECDVVAYLFASTILALKEKAMLTNPCHAVAHEIEHADAEGRPMRAEEQDVRSYAALAKTAFYTGKENFFGDVLLAMLYHGTSQDFDDIRRTERDVAKYLFALEYDDGRFSKMLTDHAEQLVKIRSEPVMTPGQVQDARDRFAEMKAVFDSEEEELKNAAYAKYDKLFPVFPKK